MKMPPDVDFKLTEEGFRNYERLLAEQGITACPKGRETIEDLEQGTVSIFGISGMLQHDGREFIYNVQQDNTGCRLSIHAFDHGPTPGEAIMAAAGRAFPQPKRILPAQPRAKRPWDASRVITTIGCLGFIVLFAALCFFAVIGVRSFLR